MLVGRSASRGWGGRLRSCPPDWAAPSPPPLLRCGGHPSPSAWRHASVKRRWLKVRQKATAFARIERDRQLCAVSRDLLRRRLRVVSAFDPREQGLHRRDVL